MQLGFIGLGIMGLPMALNLAHAGTSLIVWNRTPARAQALRELGAQVAANSAEVFERAETIVLMLANEGAIDGVLARGTAEFARRVRERTIVHMGTTSPEYSQALERDVRAAAGHYVEAPVSGSRKPAEMAQLVCMMAGEAGAVQRVAPLLAPMCRQAVSCGPVPCALRMKLAVNLYLVTTVAALAESFHFAREHGLDLQQFRAILDSGQMASDVSKLKLHKLVAGDFEAQAAILDVLKNSELVAAAARAAGIASPLLDRSRALYASTAELGHGERDMAAVVFALEHLSAQGVRRDGA